MTDRNEIQVMITGLSGSGKTSAAALFMRALSELSTPPKVTFIDVVDPETFENPEQFVTMLNQANQSLDKVCSAVFKDKTINFVEFRTKKD